jgi:predicted phosphodiesterase
MKIWILCDLHLELTRGWDLPAVGKRPDFDVMVVAGDLITRFERGVAWLLERVADRPVLVVAGNHEGYGTDLELSIKKARAAAAGTNLRVLQNDCCIIGDVTFVGAILWTDFMLFGDQKRAMAHAAEVMNDYRKIRTRNYQYKLRPQDTLASNKESRAYFASVVRNRTTEKICAITHHGPAPASAKSGTERDLTSAAYVNGEHVELMRGVHTWIHGHTHETRTYMIGETRTVTNGKGYGPWPPREPTWENPNFDPTFTIEI